MLSQSPSTSNAPQTVHPWPPAPAGGPPRLSQRLHPVWGILRVLEPTEPHDRAHVSMESKLPERLARHTRGIACVSQTRRPSGVTGAQQARSHPGARAGWLPCQQDSGRVLIHLDEALMQADSSDCGQPGDCLKDKVTRGASWCRHLAGRGSPHAPPGHPLALSHGLTQSRGTCGNSSFKTQRAQASAQRALPAAPSKGSTEAPRPCGSCQTSPHQSPHLHARSLTFRRAPRGPPPSLSCPQQPWNTHSVQAFTPQSCRPPRRSTPNAAHQPQSSSASVRPGSHLSVCPLPPALARLPAEHSP